MITFQNEHCRIIVQNCYAESPCRIIVQNHCAESLCRITVQSYLVSSPCQKLNPYSRIHGLRTPSEEIAFTARPKIQSQSQIFRYGQSIRCLPQRPNFSDIFDLCLHWVSVVRVWDNLQPSNLSQFVRRSLLSTVKCRIICTL